MEEQPDGSLVVTFGATDLAWAARIALWYGTQVTVLEPEALRKRMSEEAGAIAAKYASLEGGPAPS
jgi:predicted DNA-binding transcriptional regulator YafY